MKGLEDEENWILAEVVQYISSANKYEVDDIVEEQKDRHILSKRHIVPLPLMKANPETDGQALSTKGTTVMALYPQTTCFYKAVINQLPQTANEEYEVLFEDPTYADGYSPLLFDSLLRSNRIRRLGPIPDSVSKRRPPSLPLPQAYLDRRQLGYIDCVHCRC